MASFDDATHWVGQHPYLAGATVFGGGLALLWLFGFFSSSSGSQAASPNLAGAFYQAEAAQTQAGAAIQIATLQTASDTAKTKIQADAATAIQSSQSDMAMTINSQNVGRDNIVGGYALTASQTQSYADLTTAQYALQATMHNSDNLAMEHASDNAMQTTINDSNNQASVLSLFYNNVLPNLLSLRGGAGDIQGIGTSRLGIGTGAYTPDQLRASGFSEAQIASVLNLPAA